MSDFFAKSMTKFFRFTADTFFRERYGHRAVVLETVAAVPGMIAGMLTHFASLRTLRKGYGTKIHQMLEEAENERKHLIFVLHITKPTKVERAIIVVAQVLFSMFYFSLYMISPKTAHRMIGYFEEEAVRSYTDYIQEVDLGNIKDVPAPRAAIEYYKLRETATLRDMLWYIREDERNHGVLNHRYADRYESGIL
jgi:ubiquinol oxidase